MKETIKKILPRSIQDLIKPLYHSSIDFKHKYFGLPAWKGETSKAKIRREREGFFKKYCNGKGLDVGYGGDIICKNAFGFDRLHGDAQTLNTIPDEKYDFVYSSHTIEHMQNPALAIKNWWRVLKKGGYLILFLPHRDLYEKKTALPSRWNEDHKHFFLLDRDETPDTIGIVPLIRKTLENYEIIYAKVCDEGHTISAPNVHSDGEYSIEIVIQKNTSNYKTQVDAHP